MNDRKLLASAPISQAKAAEPLKCQDLECCKSFAFWLGRAAQVNYATHKSCPIGLLRGPSPAFPLQRIQSEEKLIIQIKIKVRFLRKEDLYRTPALLISLLIEFC